MNMKPSNSKDFLRIVILPGLLGMISAAPLKLTPHIPSLSQRQTLPSGMNEAGFVTLCVFGPLAAIMFTWAAWFVCIGDCVKRRSEKRRAIRAEKLQQEEEEQKRLKALEELNKLQTQSHHQSRNKLQKQNGNAFEMQPLQSMRV